MRKSDIKEGKVYIAKVSGKITLVRVDRIESNKQRSYTGILGNKRTIRGTTCYWVTNLTTGRETTFRSASKFREESRWSEYDPNKHVLSADGRCIKNKV